MGVTNVRTFLDPGQPEPRGIARRRSRHGRVRGRDADPRAAEAMEHDGVRAETLIVLVEAIRGPDQLGDLAAPLRRGDAPWRLRLERPRCAEARIDPQQRELHREAEHDDEHRGPDRDPGEHLQVDL